MPSDNGPASPTPSLDAVATKVNGSEDENFNDATPALTRSVRPKNKKQKIHFNYVVLYVMRDFLLY